MKGSYAYSKAYKLALQGQYRQALPDLERAVASGHPMAAYALATWFLHGVGVRKNYKKAFALLKKASEQNAGRAMLDLAIFYERGPGTFTINKKKAFFWYNKAALKGLPDAQMELSRCYYWGIGTSRNYKEAFRWRRKAARNGNVEAQFELALMYEYGDGTGQNQRLARVWYSKAAKRGHVAARQALKELPRRQFLSV